MTQAYDAGFCQQDGTDEHTMLLRVDTAKEVDTIYLPRSAGLCAYDIKYFPGTGGI